MSTRYPVYPSCQSKAVLKKITANMVDGFSKLSGYAAVREWTPAPRRGEHILALKAYTQINTFSCGVAAGFSVVKSFCPKARFEDFYALIQPDTEQGTSLTTLRNALRQNGIRVKSPRLSYPALLQHIRQGRLVIVAIRNPGADSPHYVVAYGFGEDHVVLASNGFPWLHRKRFARKDFMAMWEPKGNSLVCWHERHRLSQSRGELKSR